VSAAAAAGADDQPVKPADKDAAQRRAEKDAEAAKRCACVTVEICQCDECTRMQERPTQQRMLPTLCMTLHRSGTTYGCRVLQVYKYWSVVVAKMDACHANSSIIHRAGTGCS
jgi:hypothetical protein